MSREQFIQESVPSKNTSPPKNGEVLYADFENNNRFRHVSDMFANDAMMEASATLERGDSMDDGWQEIIRRHDAELREHRQYMRESMDRIDAKFDRMDDKMDTIAERLDNKIDAMADKLDNKIDALGEKMETKFDVFTERVDSKLSETTRHVQNMSYTVMIGIGSIVITAIIALILNH